MSMRRFLPFILLCAAAVIPMALPAAVAAFSAHAPLPAASL